MKKTTNTPAKLNQRVQLNGTFARPESTYNFAVYHSPPERVS